MDEKKTSLKDPRTQDILDAFERERSTAEELNRRHTESTRQARRRDRQVLIERRRQPR